jgi:pimeloyl-ACP methyl ester carboxylesterase
VFTPSLTGLGERSHLVSPLVTLSTHVRDLVNLVLFEDLRDIVLVGHSYGGAVITGSVDHIGDRIQHLVFLDAFVPRNGESIFALLGAGDRGNADRLPGEWLIPPPERRFDSPDETEWANARRRPHPVACFAEPVTLARPLESHDFTLTYIKATADPRSAPGGPAFWDAAQAAATRERWRYHEIATNHMVPHNEPAALAELLIGVIA